MSISDLEIAQSNFIGSTFVRTADENYCVARWALQNNFYTDFAWSAVHALEKYMKAILLFNGQKASDHGHDIRKLYLSITNFTGDLILTKFNTNSNIPEHISIREMDTKQFISDLYDSGNSDARYGTFGHLIMSGYMVYLDSLVYSLRRVICPLDAHLNGSVPPLTYRQWLIANPNDLISKRGLLWDRLAACSDDTMGSVANCNLAFAPPQMVHNWGWVVSSWRESPLERDVFRALQSDDRDWVQQGVNFANWLFCNVKLEQSIKREIKKLIEQTKLPKAPCVEN